MPVCMRYGKFMCIGCSDAFDPRHRQTTGQTTGQLKKLEKEKEARMGRTGARMGCGEFLGLA